jgi:hypothetical protein|tara:strand:- start:534 stop:1109 length:576 start_codon:yes stop_codon:yes gene_type:complete
MDEITILNNQLSRMRSMNKYYHDQFLFDVRILFFFTIIFHYLALTNNTAYMLIPFVSLFGSVLLSFHAHYLIFSRNYSEFIEIKLNNILGNDVLIAHKLENSYLFPIKDRKIVVAKLGSDFSWFGYVTLFITFIGISSYVYSIVSLLNTEISLYYYLFIALITLITLIIGIWWFLLGNGEKRLEKVFNEYR